ncbi:16S rRNA (cytosine(1402)-N(4))-methyltransferase RsmH [Zooshikella ganghwensis]|uniref:16S rRNA (cytosine(1402)-N(4))-methyltransferase RsmH n=1 Tax=Zooshikella ganghwensis TaxID=202772 RepID=UPI000400B46D
MSCSPCRCSELMTEELRHTTVLLDEAVQQLNIVADGIYIDGTFGRGGHSRKILSQLGAEGKLLVIDKDPTAIAIANQLAQEDSRVSVVHGSFAQLMEWVKQHHWLGRVDGILLDLGVSSPQLDDAQRGFSFLQDGPLDMRMNPDHGVSAADWIARADERDIAIVLKEYGEERFARRIANAIVRAREEAAITTTKQLAEIVAQANPSWEKHKHPATRSFQAIRIFVNRELDDLQQGLDDALQCLHVNGRLVVISFHSLEDRIVKRFIRKHEKGTEYPPGVPVTVDMVSSSQRLRGERKPVRPSEVEVQQNPRARSSIMRVATKLR